MELSGSHVSRGCDQQHHLALFARDALGLASAATVDNVPPLLGDVPDRSAVIAEPYRAEAIRAWESWWAAIIATPVTAELLVARGRPKPGGSVLNRAVSAVKDDAHVWFTEHDPDRRGFSDDHRYWQISKRAAETTGRELGVSIDELSADVNLLLVQGHWSRRPAPGIAFCSVAVDADDDLLYALLRKTFASSVL